MVPIMKMPMPIRPTPRSAAASAPPGRPMKAPATMTKPPAMKTPTPPSSSDSTVPKTGRAIGSRIRMSMAPRPRMPNTAPAADEADGS
ncbi:hypothetical protein D9M72_588310 [compost metagenome]